jgi:hypothetical protein
VTAGAGLALTPRHHASATAPGPVTTCPAAPPSAAPGPGADQPGDLVPAGAVAVVRCDVGVAASPTPGTSAAPRRPARPVVGTDVGALVAQVNALPAAPPHLRCNDMAYATMVFLVFSYPDRAPVVVTVDQNCELLRTATRTRSYTGVDFLGLTAKHG